MAIKYTNISSEKYYNLSSEERKENAYCVQHNYGNISWRVNGLYHREDGPAEIWPDGIKYWHLNGFRYSFEDWLEKLNKSDEEKLFFRIKYGN